MRSGSAQDENVGITSIKEGNYKEGTFRSINEKPPLAFEISIINDYLSIYLWRLFPCETGALSQWALSSKNIVSVNL